MKGKHYPKSLSCSIACSRGTLPLTSPRRGSKLLKKQKPRTRGLRLPLITSYTVRKLMDTRIVITTSPEFLLKFMLSV